MKVQRFDSVKFQAKFDRHGFLVDMPIVARIGLQIYHKPDGSERREFRPASEVFKADALASFQGKPITLGHVTVTPENASSVVVGACSGQGIPDGVGVRVPVSVYSDKAISKAKQKVASELSVGYDTIDIEQPGWGNEETGDYVLDSSVVDQSGKQDSKGAIPPPPDESKSWVRFDAVQTEIEVNHIAMVFRGRAGIAKLNLDSSQEFPYDEHETLNNEGKDMKVIKVDGVDFEVTPQVADHVVSISAKLDAATASSEALKAKNEALQAKIDSMPETIKQEVEKAVAKAKEDSALMVGLQKVAENFGVKHDGMDAKAIKCAVVMAAINQDVSTKEDAYIDAYFDVAKNSDMKAANREQVDGVPSKTKKDTAEAEIPDPQKRFRK